MKPYLALPLLLALGARGLAGAEECPVHVSHDGPDTVGTRIALAVRERIMDSPRFRLESNELAAVFRIKMLSVDDAATRAHEGNASALAVAYTGRIAKEPSLSLFIHMSILVYGTDRVKEGAESIVAELDRATARFPCP